MSTLFATLLTGHVVLGLIGTIASFMVTFMLVKPNFSHTKVLKTSFVAFLTFTLSWILGGWYYWKYYGTAVKPKIMSGDYVWAHSIFMEAKEHVFLFLPFATLCLFLLLRLNADAIANDSVLQKRVVFLALTITIIAVIITLSGVLITGGAR